MPIEIKELSFSYDSKPFIDNLDLKIDDGEMVGIIGNTGCEICDFSISFSFEYIFSGTPLEMISPSFITIILSAFTVSSAYFA